MFVQESVVANGVSESCVPSLASVEFGLAILAGPNVCAVPHPVVPESPVEVVSVREQHHSLAVHEVFIEPSAVYGPQVPGLDPHAPSISLQIVLLELSLVVPPTLPPEDPSAVLHSPLPVPYVVQEPVDIIYYHSFAVPLVVNVTANVYLRAVQIGPDSLPVPVGIPDVSEIERAVIVPANDFAANVLFSLIAAVAVVVVVGVKPDCVFDASVVEEFPKETVASLVEEFHLLLEDRDNFEGEFHISSIELVHYNKFKSRF